VKAFLELLPGANRPGARMSFPVAAAKTLAFKQSCDSVQWAITSLMQAREASDEQMALVCHAGLPVSTWMQCIRCLRLRELDGEAVLKVMPTDTFYDMISFLCRLAHSSLHQVLDFPAPYKAFVAEPIVRTWAGASGTLGTCIGVCLEEEQMEVSDSPGALLRALLKSGTLLPPLLLTSAGLRRPQMA